MKVTAIKQQVRQQGRYSIFLDGKYWCGLSDTALLDSKLVVGQELNESEAGELKKLSADDKLYAQVLNYLAIRPRSQGEIELYLRRKNADPLLSRQLVNKLTNVQLLDDTAFARSWVASRRLLRSTSHQRLRQELRAKQIADDIIAQVLAEDEVSDDAVLRGLVARKRQQARYQDDQKLAQYLARQGYRYDDIKQAMKCESDDM